MSKWKTVLLSNIGEITTGNTPKTSDLENYETNDIPFLKPSDFNTDSIDLLRTEFYISEKARNKARILPMGSIAVTCIGIIGKTKILNMECAFNQQINAIIPKNDNYNRYIAYAISFQKDLLQTQANAAVVPIINKSNFSKILIPLPPIETQRKIADNLDKVNHTIDLCKAILEKLDLLVKARFVEMFGDPISNPNKWKTVKLGDVCTIERGGSPRPIKDFLTNDNDGINWIKIGDTDSSKYITKTEQKIIKEGVKKSRYVKVGDFLLSNSMSFGKPYILKIDGCIHDGWLVIHDEKNTFNKDYLYYYLASPIMYNHFKSLAVGGVVNNLNSKMVRNVSVPLPPLELQIQFSDFTEQIEKSKQKVSETLGKAETLKKALMQVYFK